MKNYKKLITIIFFLILVFLPKYVNANTAGCVFLVYHNFTEDGAKSTSVSPKIFRQHLNYLKNNDFKVMSLEKVIDAIIENKELPDKCVSLTADDGYKSIYENAYPLLKEFNMPMAVFVATKAIDDKYPAMMTWSQLMEISNLVSSYNHSINHYNLIKKDIKTINIEITQAQKRLKQELGVKRKFFAHPYGEFDNKVYKELLNLGYIAFGQQSGVASKYSDLLNIARYSMASIYANMDSFIIKVNSLAMPVIAEEPKSMIIEKGQRPILKLKFDRHLNEQERANFSCFVSGQNSPTLSWNNNEVTIRALEALKDGRSRYNCTLASNEKGRYYWYSKLWLSLAD